METSNAVTRKLTVRQRREIGISARFVGELYRKELARQLLARAERSIEDDPLETVRSIVDARIAALLDLAGRWRSAPPEVCLPASDAVLFGPLPGKSAAAGAGVQ